MVAVEEPITWIIRDYIELDLPHMSWHYHRIFEHVAHPEVVTMQVHRMAHGTVIRHPNTNMLVFSDGNGVRFGIRFAVNRLLLISTHHPTAR